MSPAQAHITILRFFRSISSIINRSPALITDTSRLLPLPLDEVEAADLVAVLKTFFLSGFPIGFKALNFRGTVAGVERETFVVNVVAGESDGSVDEGPATVDGMLSEGVLEASSDTGGEAFLPKERTSFSPSSRLRPSSALIAADDEGPAVAFRNSASL